VLTAKEIHFNIIPARFKMIAMHFVVALSRV
jgi:hypothetical protein